MALTYQIAITNVWWNRGEVDTRFFSSKDVQKAYFDAKTLYWNSLNNFILNDNITTTAVFRDNSNRSIAELLSCNYAIVKQTGSTTYRYYFITAIKQDSANQVIVSLDLDDIQNNLIGNTSNFNNVFVKRWTGANVEYTSGVLKYPLGFKSYISDGDSPQLYNKSTQEAFIEYTGNNDLDTWLNNNIRAWRYAFVVLNQQLVGGTPAGPGNATGIVAESSVFIKQNNIISLPYSALSCPVYKTNKGIYLKYEYNSTTYYARLNNSSVDAIFNYTQGQYTNYPKGTYCFEEKISNILPFNDYSNYEIDVDGDLILEVDVQTYLKKGITNFYFTSASIVALGESKATANDVVCAGYSQTKPTYNIKINLPSNYLSGFSNSFTDSKLLDIDYAKIRLRIANQYYDYNPLAYMTNNAITQITGEYTEILKAGVSKIYFRLESNGEYKYSSTLDYTGVIASMDLTEAILTNQWADYYASHKNYYMQTAFNNTIGLVKGGIGALGSQGSSKQLQQGFNTGVNLFSNIINQQYERENMQQAPDSLSNANGDPYFNVAVSGIKPVVDFLSISDTTKNALMSKFRESGIPFNRLLSFSQVLGHHNKYCVLSCEIGKPLINLSLKEYQRLKAKLSEINRFWYSDDVDFTGANYYES